MSEGEADAWLVGSDGSRRRVGVHGLLLGRGPACDVVLSDAMASKEQALIRWGRSGLELHALGRNPTLVGGQEVDRLYVLRGGDRVTVPGADFTVEVEAEPDRSTSWTLCVGGTTHRIPTHPLTIGSSPRDELRIDALPPGALTLFVAGDGLLVEVTEEGFTVDERRLEPDEVHPVARGRTLRWGEVAIKLGVGGPMDAPTTHLGLIPILRRIEFRYMPTGGELTVDMTNEVVACQLSELRCRLAVALLQPSEPYAVGEFVPDEVILSQVWPRQPERSHYDLNTLVHRLRKDLLRAGLDPTQLVERARGGGGTRFRVGDGVTVVVE